MFHKTEIENLLNKIQTDKNVSNIDKDLFREKKKEKLRREKESLTIERNNIKLKTMIKKNLQIKFYLQKMKEIKILLKV